MEYRGFSAQMQQNQLYRTPSSSLNYTALEGGLLNRRSVGGGSDILLEVEKMRMREEIRRQYLIEGEMRGMQSGGGGFLSSYDRFQPRVLHGQSYASMDLRTPLPFYEDLGRNRRQPGELLGLEDRRTLVPFQEDYGGSRHQPGDHLGLDVVPQGPKVKEIITLTPKVGENGIIGMDKPYRPNQSGAKRKLPPPASSPGCGETENSSCSKKKTTEWSCALCQVSATSERGLQDHLIGKKHQAKAAELKVNHTGKTEKAVTEKSEKLPGSVEMNSDDDKKLEGECSGQKFKFWCRMCKVGASDKKEMNMHKKGVTHLQNQLKRAQKWHGKAGRRSRRI